MKTTETVIINTSSEHIISLDVIIASANEAFNGFNFEKTFIDLIYHYTLEQSLETPSIEYYKKVQSLAVWTYFIKGPESIELNIINSCLSICGHQAIHNETQAELELF